MKLHEIKLSEPYAKAKKNGIKPFEIRKNDRDYKVGDLVKYNIVENYTEPYPPNRTLTRESQNKELTNYFDNRVFKIKYITNYEQKDGYVVFVDESYYIGDNMESEKVKEIKKALECNADYKHYDKLSYIDGYKCKLVAYADILTYINELESENERLKILLAQANAGIVNCSGCKLVELNAVKEFAEKIKERYHNYYPSIDHYCCSEKAVNVKDIDKLLKEYDK